jgi:hypothetical protein
VQARLRDAARAGAGDEALVEEQLRRRLRLGGGEHRAAPGGAGGEEQARQHLALIGDRSALISTFFLRASAASGSGSERQR